mgnify:CR=1 FL=1
MDADVVDLSNLQRQILHSTDRIGVSKAESAKQTINALNPDVQVRIYNERLTVDNVMSYLSGSMTSSSTVAITSRRAIWSTMPLSSSGKPVVHGSIFQFEGQASVFKPHAGPCYRCLFPTPPPPGMVPS